MAKVIPSHLADGVDNSNYAGMAYDSIRLIMGEVQKIYLTDDPLNVSKKVVEYDVWANLYENGVFASRTVRAARASDLFGSGLADEFTYTLRADSSVTALAGNKKLGDGNGSKVLCMAINGMPVNYMIIGGIRNSKALKMDPADGHHLDFSFNGVEARINDDGEFSLSYTGANNADGSLRDGVDSNSIGTNVTISKNGDLVLADGGGNNSVTISHSDNKITIEAASEIDIKSNQVKIGTAPTEPAVLGNQLASILNQLLIAIQALTVNVLGSPSTPPMNLAQFTEIQTQLNTILSQSVTIQN